MRLHLCQYRLIAGSPADNREKVRDLVMAKPLDRSGLLLLPEIFSTGVLPEAEADRMRGVDEGDRRFLAALAKESGQYVLGSTAGGTPESLHNLSLLYDPQGLPIGAYRKMHPFSFAGEHRVFSPGHDVAVFPLPAFTLQPTLCYDLRFPELYRAGVDRGADLLTVQANWPVNRQAHWDVLLRARAIENQAFVAGVNCLGHIGQVEFKGGSLVVSPRGDTLLQAGEDEGVFSVWIDPDLVKSWRRVFPALRDRRPPGLFKPSCG